MAAAHSDAGAVYVFVTGGVLSGIGKGMIASSTALLLKSHGLCVTSMKAEPYLNVDAGLISPFEHGEVFVLDDGEEGDLDFGNYERFLGSTCLRSANNFTMGKVYSSVLGRERRGGYLGKTVQIIPHVTDYIQDTFEAVAAQCVDSAHADVTDAAHAPDVCVTEVGGTIGDIEGGPFVEALRQFRLRVGPARFFLIHVSLVPTIGPRGGEQKSKPTQNSLKDLRALGLSPDLLLCRTTAPLHDGVRRKIAMFANLPTEHVLSIPDVPNLLSLPLVLQQQGLERHIFRKCALQPPLALADLSAWTHLVRRFDELYVAPPSTSRAEVHIALVGKYVTHHDSYFSVAAALEHAALQLRVRVVVDWIEGSDLEEPVKEADPDRHRRAWAALENSAGVLIPGAFGSRGVEGLVRAVQFAREALRPLLGICVGMQVQVVEVCRHVLGWDSANSAEFDPSAAHAVVVEMPCPSPDIMGGTMCLGSKKTHLTDPDSLVARLYGGATEVFERHRHRYEVNPALVAAIVAGSHMRFPSIDDSGRRYEIVEYASEHPFFLGMQAHPEYLSRPLRPSPVYAGFVAACAGRLDEYLDSVAAAAGGAPQQLPGSLPPSPKKPRR